MEGINLNREECEWIIQAYDVAYREGQISDNQHLIRKIIEEHPELKDKLYEDQLEDDIYYKEVKE